MSIEEIDNEPERHEKRILTKNGIKFDRQGSSPWKLRPKRNTWSVERICGVIKDGKDTPTITFDNKPPNDRRIGRKGTYDVVRFKTGSYNSSKKCWNRARTYETVHN